MWRLFLIINTLSGAGRGCGLTVVDYDVRFAPFFADSGEDALDGCGIGEVAGDVEEVFVVVCGVEGAGDAGDAVPGCCEGGDGAFADVGAGAEEEEDGFGRHGGWTVKSGRFRCDGAGG